MGIFKHCAVLALATLSLAEGFVTLSSPQGVPISPTKLRSFSPSSITSDAPEAAFSESHSFGFAAAAAAVATAVALAGSRRSSSMTRKEGLVAMHAHRKPTKNGRKLIVMECTVQRQMVKDGVPGAGGPRGGVHRFYTQKNVRNTPHLLELMKHNKYLNRHTLHREIK
eukprot:TRINITY_DN2765_c0_g1_i4.p1 TRINITY_DN2765_c0_g1~~TRINITY_DN2765_c0_g1_i4.p1  ORF type:complete len:168 (-),score=37.23 TRINITY_DN2765_c0_g1_i4:305-808(-)